MASAKYLTAVCFRNEMSRIIFHWWIHSGNRFSSIICHRKNMKVRLFLWFYYHFSHNVMKTKKCTDNLHCWACRTYVSSINIQTEYYNIDVDTRHVLGSEAYHFSGFHLSFTPVLYLALSLCISLYPFVSHFIPWHLALSFCISLYPFISTLIFAREINLAGRGMHGVGFVMDFLFMALEN